MSVVCIISTCVYIAVCMIDVCTLPSVAGPCSKNITRWFYNYQAGRCQQFTYGGCNGNQNNFDSLKSCHGTCGNYNYHYNLRYD